MAVNAPSHWVSVCATFYLTMYSAHTWQQTVLKLQLIVVSVRSVFILVLYHQSVAVVM
jgi:hypothetical protein